MKLTENLWVIYRAAQSQVEERGSDEGRALALELEELGNVLEKIGIKELRGSPLLPAYVGPKPDSCKACGQKLP